MRSLKCQIVAGEVENKATNKKGIVEDPLINSIPIDHIVFSLLHAQIGVGNKMLDSFLEWVDYRVENLPIEEIIARDAY